MNLARLCVHRRDATDRASTRRLGGADRIAWLLAQPQVTSVLIIGAKRPDQLADNIAATQVALSADELKQLARVSRLP